MNKITFKNIDTGVSITSDTVVEFCRKIKEKGRAARNELSKVKTGKKLHYKKWTLPSIYLLIKNGTISPKRRNSSRNWVPCSLINLFSGERIEAKSITEFCEKAGIKNSVTHITPILQGKRLQLQGWCLEKTYDILTKKNKFYDIYGNKYILTGLELHSKRGIRRLTDICKLLTGKKKIHCGIALSPDFPPLPPNPYRRKNVSFKKKGKVFKAKGVTALSRKLNISRRSLYDVIIGMREKTKGFSFNKIETEKRQLIPN